MIFPNNGLLLKRARADQSLIIDFNAFDALKQVNHEKLPGFEVGPSTAWQEARKELPLREFQQPFDWTFTSKYKGTLGPGVSVEKASLEEDINFERLKQPDPIMFYDEVSLYEDELADHGCAQVCWVDRWLQHT